MASQKGNDDVATPEMTGTVVRTTPVKRLIGAMAMDATMDAEEGSFSGDDVIAILEAENEADMWEADMKGPLNFQHLAGCELAVTDIQVKYGRGGNDDDIKTMFVTDDGKQMYLMVTCARISDAGGTSDRILPTVGETFQANTSARFIVAKLWWLSTHGYIDSVAGKVAEVQVQSIDLGGGRAVIKLRPVPQRATRA